MYEITQAKFTRVSLNFLYNVTPSTELQSLGLSLFTPRKWRDTPPIPLNDNVFLCKNTLLLFNFRSIFVAQKVRLL